MASRSSTADQVRRFQKNLEQIGRGELPLSLFRESGGTPGLYDTQPAAIGTLSQAQRGLLGNIGWAGKLGSLGLGLLGVATPLGAVTGLLGTVSIADAIARALGVPEAQPTMYGGFPTREALRDIRILDPNRYGTIMEAMDVQRESFISGIMDAMAKIGDGFGARDPMGPSSTVAGPLGPGMPGYGIGEEAASGLLGGGGPGGLGDTGGRDPGSAGDRGTGTGAESGSGYV